MKLDYIEKVVQAHGIIYYIDNENHIYGDDGCEYTDLTNMTKSQLAAWLGY